MTASSGSSEQTPPARRHAPRPSGRVLFLVGKVSLTAAGLLALYLAWLIWGTGIYTARVQGQLREDLAERFQGDNPVFAGLAQGSTPLQLHGEAWAIMKIPAIDLDVVVVEGVSPVDLKKGPGHYVGTAFPWYGRGSVAIAGHRTTYGAPFWSLNELKTRDRISLLTEVGTFVYEVDSVEVVAPGAIEVLQQTGEPTLVLTTCNPRFSASQRLVVFAEQVAAY